MSNKLLRGFPIGVIPRGGAVMRYPNEQWWISDQSSRVQYAGIPSASIVYATNLNGSTTGLTIISGKVQERCRQHGYIRQVKIGVFQVGLGVLKIKLFRPNGVNYDFVAESSDVVLATDVQTINLTTPLACRPGDVLGIYLPGDALDANRIKIYAVTSSGSNLIRYATGDISTTNVFSSTVNDLVVGIEGLGVSPIFAATGDSIAVGYNGWQSFYDSGPAGTLASEPWYKLRQLINDGFEYQNHGNGAETFAWVLSTGIVSALATGAKYILVHCGVNDVQAGRTWAAVESDLDAIKVLFDAANPLGSRKLLIDEIMPWTNGTDGNAATIRTWNGNLATWCTANGATLVMCHDAMGQTRVSTGELDDLKTAYDDDGVHPNSDGYSALAALIKAHLP